MVLDTNTNCSLKPHNHRYWNQLNEDIRVMLQRFDAETGDELETAGESDATTR